MSYILKIQRGQEVDAQAVDGPTLIIGRAGGAQLRLDDPTVEVEHARIDRLDGTFVLSDLGSTLGTYVNGVNTQKRLLANGDRIAIGPYSIFVNGGEDGIALTLEITKPQRQQQAAVKVDRRVYDYAQVYALSRWYWNKTMLSIVATVGSAILLLAPLRAGKRQLFEAGAPIRGHALFAAQCERCHEPWRGVSENRCQECHGAQIHHREQTATPPCSSCHAEHRGPSRLTASADARCVQCHAALKTKSGQPARVETHVTNFASDHPEFTVPVKADSSVTRARLSDRGARQADPATIKLNHLLHLRPNLKGPKGPVQLGCKDCHQPAADGTLMQPITYAAQCRSCHALAYDPGRTDDVVPHAAPIVVDAFLSKVYPKQSGKVGEIEANLFKNSCATCHELEQEAVPLPEIKPAEMTSRWFAHAQFSHQAHRVLECNACHTRAARSRRTSDVLIPGIEICQQCHKEDQARWPAQSAAAPLNCKTCHVYHSRTSPVDWDGPLNLRRLLEAEENHQRALSTQSLSVFRYLRNLGEVFNIRDNRR